jgi:Sulfotransferase domain
MKPLDFLIIGAPKAGTTALFRYLRCHPKIYIPLSKELPFFSEDAEFAKGWDKFAKEFFSGASVDMLWGKVTPQYMQNSSVPERIAKVMPQVKLIAQLRNPIDRAFSSYRFLVRRGVESRPFEEAFFNNDARKQGWYAPFGKYANILGTYLNHFSRQQLLVTFSEDLDQKPQFVIDSLMSHLGLKTDFSPQNLGERYNVGGARTRFPWLVYTVKQGSLFRSIWKTLPARIKIAVVKWYSFEVAAIPENAPILPPELRSKLLEYYREDVLQLEKIINSKVPWREFH